MNVYQRFMISFPCCGAHAMISIDFIDFGRFQPILFLGNDGIQSQSETFCLCNTAASRLKSDNFHIFCLKGWHDFNFCLNWKVLIWLRDIFIFLGDLNSFEREMTTSILSIQRSMWKGLMQQGSIPNVISNTTNKPASVCIDC